MAKAKKIKRVGKLKIVKHIRLIKKYLNKSKLSENVFCGRYADKEVSKPISPDNIRVCKRMCKRKSKA